MAQVAWRGALVSTEQATVGVAPAKPFLKWAGGKRRLALAILAKAPKTKYRAYVEPFLGGGAVFWQARAMGIADRYILNDVNRELSWVYYIVQNRSEQLCDALEEMEKEYLASSDRRAMYNAVRAQKPMDLQAEKEAARFIFLNKTCFNGLHRVNKKGQFNTPFGKYEKPTICDRQTIMECAAALKGASIRSTDFMYEMMEAPRESLIYADPPYFPVSKTSSFASYASDGFDAKDQQRLAQTARRCVQTYGCTVILSNADVPAIYDLYGDSPFEIHKISVARPINSKASGRGNVGEVIIVGKP